MISNDDRWLGHQWPAWKRSIISAPGTCTPAGIIPEAIQNLFQHLEQRRKELEANGEEVTLKVRVSALEIYNEELRDLFVQGGVVHDTSNDSPKTSRFGSARSSQKQRIDVRDARKNSGFSTEVGPSALMPELVHVGAAERHDESHMRRTRITSLQMSCFISLSLLVCFTLHQYTLL